MAVRGVQLTYETVRAWCRKFAQTYANQIRSAAVGHNPVTSGTWTK